MKLVVLTSTYPATSTPEATPVVHYFAKEWVKMGHEIVVFHLLAKYPRVYYTIGKWFKSRLDSRLGSVIPIVYPVNYEETIDGVYIKHVTMKKYRPHGRYSKNVIHRIANSIYDYCNQTKLPNYFLAHWDNPQLEVLAALKAKCKIPTCLVFHENKFSLENRYGKDLSFLLESIDAYGFRNKAAKEEFERKYGHRKNSFMAFSGVSSDFIKAGDNLEKDFSNVSKFVYVGNLMERKHGDKLIKPLSMAYPDGHYSLTFIGDGNLKFRIEEKISENGQKDKVVFTGKIERKNIISYLRDSDVFIMISEGEIFGLVYLEAMALGVIPIASIGEGIDGIIKDSYNGFLCKAGDEKELYNVLLRIKNMQAVELEVISKNARDTALSFSDAKVAERYLAGLPPIEK